MVFQQGEVRVAGVDSGISGREGGLGDGPEDVIVVGEVGEEDAEKEAGCWRGLSAVGVLAEGIDVRPTMRKVANDPTPRMAISETVAVVVVSRGGIPE